MKQLDLFDSCEPKREVATEGNKWTLYIDGASRRNPGLSGAGIYLSKNDEPMLKKGFFLGEKTNNQAEYLALLIGLFYSKKQLGPQDTLYIFSDSELLIKQMKGEYKVRHHELKHYFSVAKQMLKDVSFSFCHVLREYNKIADKMANVGIDKEGVIPRDFLQFLKKNEITI